MAKRWVWALGFVWVLCNGLQVRGQAQTLVIEGGTLIDGTGRNPVKNAVVVIEGNRFEAVGVKGKVSYPKNAKVIKADGKTILPGLIDTEAQGNWFYGPPLYLYFGVTTVYFHGSPYMRAQKELQEKGQLKGPRMFLTAGYVDGPPELLIPIRKGSGAQEWPDSAKMWPKGWSVRTPEEARAAVEKRVAEAGGNASAILVDGGIPPEILRAVSDQAHKHGLVVTGRSEFVSTTAENGQDITIHMAGIVRSTITKPESVAKLKEMKEGKDWYMYWVGSRGLFEYMMEPAAFDPLIKTMVQHHMYIAPTLAHCWWLSGTQIPHAKEWEAELIEFAKNTPGLEFVPQGARDQWLRADKTAERVKGVYPLGDQIDASHPQEMEGYAKVDEFLRRFVKAGGKIIGGGDNSYDLLPALITHQELQQLVYSGLTPMQAILSVTKWAAEAWHNDKNIGTIEPGKLADLITVNGDPLANIKNTRNVDLLIMDGKIVDRTLDPNWKNPIPQPAGEYSGRRP
jgi:amidohydrolase family protein